MQFVAINFHQKALADRLEENRLGLKALDCLSNAHPVVSKKPHQKHHKRMSSVGTIDLAALSHHGQQDEPIDTSTTKGHRTTLVNGSSKIFSSKYTRALQPKRQKKKVASVIVDQVRHFAHQA